MNATRVPEQLDLLNQPPKRMRGAALSSFFPSSPRTTVEEALDGEARAASQDEVILALFKAYEDRALSPSEVANKVNRGRVRAWPQTSIRRSLTTLTKRGLLRRLPERRMGPLGALEHVWSLAE